jgi:CYTH domain-containing protein
MFSVDIFEGKLSGLVLAETTFDTAEEVVLPLDLPAGVGREVSNDPRFTGGTLAGLSADEAAELLRRIRPAQS